MGEARNTTPMGGGRSQGVGKFLQGCFAGNSIVLVRNLGPLASMAKRIYGMHTNFLPMITRKRAKQLEDGTWETPGAEGIREAAGTQLDRIYIERCQTTVAQWVALRPLFEVCARETGYEGGL